MMLVRHPETAAPKGLCYGRSEPGLSAHGASRIPAVARSLPSTGRVISSPARRCQALATAMAHRNGTSVETDPRLQELDFGTWEGRLWSDIPRAESDPWAADPWAVAPPGGETFGSLHARVAAALADVPADAVVVTHAGVIRAARMIVEGLSFDDVFAWPVPYAEPIVLSRRAA